LTKSEAFGVSLPVADYPINTELTVGRWDGQEWSQNGIIINEEKDGSIYFNTDHLGAFRFFVGKLKSAFLGIFGQNKKMSFREFTPVSVSQRL